MSLQTGRKKAIDMQNNSEISPVKKAPLMVNLPRDKNSNDIRPTYRSVGAPPRQLMKSLKLKKQAESAELNKLKKVILDQKNNIKMLHKKLEKALVVKEKTKKEKEISEKSVVALTHKNAFLQSKITELKESNQNDIRKLRAAAEENRALKTGVDIAKSDSLKTISNLKVKLNEGKVIEEQRENFEKTKAQIFERLGYGAQMDALRSIVERANGFAKRYEADFCDECDFGVFFAQYELPCEGLGMFGKIGKFGTDKNEFSKLTENASLLHSKLSKIPSDHVRNILRPIFKTPIEEISSILSEAKSKPFCGLLKHVNKAVSERIIRPAEVIASSDLLLFLFGIYSQIQDILSEKEKAKQQFMAFKQKKDVRNAVKAKEKSQEACRKLMRLNRSAERKIRSSLEFQIVPQLEIDDLKAAKHEILTRIKLLENDSKELKKSFTAASMRSNSKIEKLRSEIKTLSGQEKPKSLSGEIFSNSIVELLGSEEGSLEERFGRKVEQNELQNKIYKEEDKKSKLKEDLVLKLSKLRRFGSLQKELLLVIDNLTQNQDSFIHKIKKAYDFENRLTKLENDYYDVFEELYFSLFDDFENSKIKIALLEDDQSELENKLELLLSIEDIDKSAETQQKIVENKKNLGNMRSFNLKIKSYLKEMEDNKEAENIRLRIPGRKSIKKMVKNQKELLETRSNEINQRMIERLESRISEIKSRSLDSVAVSSGFITKVPELMDNETNDKTDIKKQNDKINRIEKTEKIDKNYKNYKIEFNLEKISEEKIVPENRLVPFEETRKISQKVSKEKPLKGALEKDDSAEKNLLVFNGTEAKSQKDVEKDRESERNKYEEVTRDIEKDIKIVCPSEGSVEGEKQFEIEDKKESKDQNENFETNSKTKDTKLIEKLTKDTKLIEQAKAVESLPSVNNGLKNKMKFDELEKLEDLNEVKPPEELEELQKQENFEDLESKKEGTDFETLTSMSEDYSEISREIQICTERREKGAGIFSRIGSFISVKQTPPANGAEAENANKNTKTETNASIKEQIEVETETFVVPKKDADLNPFAATNTLNSSNSLNSIKTTTKRNPLSERESIDLKNDVTSSLTKGLLRSKGRPLLITGRSKGRPAHVKVNLKQNLKEDQKSEFQNDNQNQKSKFVGKGVKEDEKKDAVERDKEWDAIVETVEGKGANFNSAEKEIFKGGEKEDKSKEETVVEVL